MITSAVPVPSCTSGPIWLAGISNLQELLLCSMRQTFDEMTYLLVVAVRQQRSWGIARTPAARMAQTKQVHDDTGLDLHWSEKPLPEQIQCWQVAYQAVLSKRHSCRQLCTQHLAGSMLHSCIESDGAGREGAPL